MRPLSPVARAPAGRVVPATVPGKSRRGPEAPAAGARIAGAGGYNGSVSAADQVAHHGGRRTPRRPGPAASSRWTELTLGRNCPTSIPVEPGRAQGGTGTAAAAAMSAAARRPRAAPAHRDHGVRGSGPGGPVEWTRCAAAGPHDVPGDVTAPCARRRGGAHERGGVRASTGPASSSPTWPARRRPTSSRVVPRPAPPEPRRRDVRRSPSGRTSRAGRPWAIPRGTTTCPSRRDCAALVPVRRAARPPTGPSTRWRSSPCPTSCRRRSASAGARTADCWGPSTDLTVHVLDEPGPVAAGPCGPGRHRRLRLRRVALWDQAGTLVAPPPR